MAKVTAQIAKAHYKVEIKSPSNNLLIADEPVHEGGRDLGFSPNELLIAALAACTNITVRMYADRKEWNLDEVNTEIHIVRDEPENKTVISRSVTFTGSLTDEQRARLLAVAKACPLHKILTGSIEINTEANLYQ